MGYRDEGNRGDAYRADWERAVNGPHVHDDQGARFASRGGTSPMPVQPASRQAYPQGYGHPQQPGYPQAGQRAYAGGPQMQYAPAPAPAYAPAPAAPPKVRRRRGRRHVSGWYIVLSWLALFAWAGFIFYMSSHTSSELAQGIFAHVRDIIERFVWKYYGYVEDPVSPIGHFCEYFIFGALLGNALHCHMPLIPATIIAIACASGYGVTDEIHQLYVDGRYFDMEDWKVDTIAATLGSILASFFFYLFGSRREYYYEYERP